jgi:restriction endonuclease S subunit
MARLTNLRDNHIARWVVPAASKLLIDEACRHASTQSLEAVANIEMGQSPSSDSVNEVGTGVPLIGGPADLGLVYPEPTRWTSSPTKLCNPGDVIVCVRATIGEPRWSDGVYCLGRGVAAVRPSVAELDRRFLFRVIEGNEQNLRESGTGTTFKTISKAHLASIQVPMISIARQEAIGRFLEWLDQHDRVRPSFVNAPDLPQILSKQQRTIVRIEELAARIEEAKGLRRGAMAEAERLLIAMAHRADLDADAKARAGWREVAIGDVVRLALDPRRVKSSESYPNFGIYSFARGLFPKPPIEGIATSADVLYRVHRGQFIYSRLFAFEGAYSMIDGQFDGYFVSNEYPTFDCDEELVNADFLSAYFKAPSVWGVVAAGSKGLGDRRQRVQPSQVLAHRLWLPPMAWQRRIAQVRARVDRLKQLQSETSEQLEALLPSLLDKAFRGEL